MPAEHPAQEHLDQAVGEAFDRARRRLIEHAERIRGDVKTHETPSHGRVVRLLPDYGFIETSEGAEVYNGGAAYRQVGTGTIASGKAAMPSGRVRGSV